jgi:rRNA maturation RNase YbeY
LIELIFKNEQQQLSYINYIFCSDEFLLNINQKYLGRYYYTDIISFDLSENKNQIQGEVYISVPRVKENAKIYKTSFKSEFYRVVFHGTLHFCGYNDRNKKEATIMRNKENHYLTSFLVKQNFM